MRLKFGCCDSELAILQSTRLLDPVRVENPWLSAELVPTAFPTEDLLRKNHVDCMIHDLRILPPDTAEELPLAVFSRRADGRWCMVLPEGSKRLGTVKPLGCFTPEQQVQLAKLYPKNTVTLLECTLQEALDLLQAGQLSGLVPAACDMQVLGLEDRISKYFSPEEVLPAPGQGILAIQTKRGTDCGCLQSVHDRDTGWCALAERSFVRALGRGCAAYAAIDGGLLTLTGLFFSGNGSLQKADVIGNPQQAVVLGETLARHMLDFAD